MKIHLYLIISLLLVSFASAEIDYFTDRMNFPPGESRTHRIDVYNEGNTSAVINITVPIGFTAGTTDCFQITTTLYSCNVAANSSKYLNIQSPNNCIENTIYKSNLLGNGFFEQLTYICIPDNKITDCKVEYGHGDANYLPNDQLYISNETTTIFNLMRVWNIGHYLSPNEAARNATIKCNYENYPLRTYGRVEIEHGTNEINGTFLWEEIESGYWFRIGVVSQEINGENVGEYYNVSCTNLTYQYEHEQVIAESTTCDLEIRTTEPFDFTLTDHPTLNGKSILTITNQEEYNVYDMSFDKYLDLRTHTESYQQLNSGESVSYVIDESTACNTSVFFIPSWYINSWHPKYYTQVLDCSELNHPPSMDPIGNLTAYVDNNFMFDVNATDIDGDNITFYDNTTLFDIDPNTGIISFTPNNTEVGNHSVNITVCDSSTCDEEIIWVFVLNQTELQPFDIMVDVNDDNKSVDINWTDANADYYIVQWSNDPNNFTNAINSSPVTDLNYTDITANETQTRYYKVIAFGGGNTEYANKTGCKHSYNFISNSDTTKGRNYLTIACNATYYAEQFLRDIPGQTATYVTQLNRWNNVELENYESHPLGSSVNNFSMDLGKGYLVFATVNVTMTIAGYAIHNPVTIEMKSNADTTKGRNYVGLPYTITGHNAESFIQGVSSATYVTQLNRWDNAELENYQSHPKGSSVNNFSMDDKGKGYLMYVTQNESHTPT